MTLRCAAALVLALTGCARALPGHPALWRIDGPHGQHGWLFGTIHALPRGVDWHTPQVTAALDQADELIVEIARLNDAAAGAQAFAALAHGPPQPPLAARVAPGLRPALARLIVRGGWQPAQFITIKTWAAALMLTQPARGDAGADAQRGVDRALLSENPAKPVAELEGETRQLAVFDRLPEPAQRVLLAAVVADAANPGNTDDRLAQAWRMGDMAEIARQTHQGMMADPVLRQALYGQRNRDWARVIAANLASGRHPFIAVGLAHMAAEAGLPMLLAASGFTVTRIE